MGALVSISMTLVGLVLSTAIRMALVALRGLLGVARLAAKLVIRAAKAVIDKRQASCEMKGAKV